ncbi:MAG: hypothetical protein PHV60_03660 [bacterium]|nr:hypothetical protein [bacterium]
MKKLSLLFLFVLTAALFLSNVADAKWWIFGQSKDEITVKYLYLNGVSFDEGGKKVMLTIDALPNGLINIKGKAAAGTGKIGAVTVTTNNKVKWEKAKLDKDGTFDYSFTAQPDKTYDIYVKIMDTRGKTNNVDDTYKRVVVSPVKMRDMVQQVLDGLIDAYQNENAAKFNTFISENFAADKNILDRAVRKDFSAFDKISLRYTLNNVTMDTKGNISVSLTFNRTVTSSQSGQTLSDTGVTEFLFRSGEDGPKVYAMKFPLIFGLSDTSEIATGQVTIGNSGTLITVSETGAVGSGSGAGASGGTGSSGTQASMTYNNVTWPGWSFESLSLSNGTKTTESWGASFITGDFGLYGDNHHLVTGTGVTYVDMGVRSLSAVTSAPASGYTTSLGSDNIEAGHCYVFKLPGGAYGAIQIISATIPVTTIRYKYSASGPDF